MRTPRNIFVINLAISDLLLCSFTIPFTLADSLTAFWELGPEMVSELKTSQERKTALTSQFGGLWKVMVMVKVVCSSSSFTKFTKPFILADSLTVFWEFGLTQDIDVGIYECQSFWEFIFVA